MNVNWTTIAQSHVRERNSRQPSRARGRSSRRVARGRRQRGSRETNAALRGTCPRRRRAPSRSRRRRRRGPARAAPTIAVVLSRARAARSPPAAGRRATARDEPSRRGRRTRWQCRRRAGATKSCQSSALPVIRSTAVVACVGEDDEVGADHHEVAREAVRPDAADEDEDDLRQLARRRGRARGPSPSRQVEHRERERDRRERAAEERAVRPGKRSRNSRSREAAPCPLRRTRVPVALEARVRLPERHRPVVARRPRRPAGRLAGRRRTPPRSAPALDPLRHCRAARAARRGAADVVDDAEVDQREPLGRAPLELVDRRVPAPRRRTRAAAPAAARSRLGWIRTPAASPA